jgi:ABC-type transport system substrate-binding protein
MKKSIQIAVSIFIMSIVVLSGCATATSPTPIPSTLTPSAIPQTSTPEATATSTLPPSPTPIPGEVTIPIETLGTSIPWLPLEKGSTPTTYFFVFNISKPPFDNSLVRQAFTAAIDQTALIDTVREIGVKTHQDHKPATSFIPPQTLGRDLYDEVGISFDPALAKNLLSQAGYADPSTFPVITVSDEYGLSTAMAEMWEKHLGIKVNVEIKQQGYMQSIFQNPPEIYGVWWFADLNDPDNFMREVFYSTSSNNLSGFSNSDFDSLIDNAAQSTNPLERQEIYIKAEILLCETEAALIPIYHATWNSP